MSNDYPVFDVMFVVLKRLIDVTCKLKEQEEMRRMLNEHMLKKQRRLQRAKDEYDAVEQKRVDWMLLLIEDTQYDLYVAMQRGLKYEEKMLRMHVDYLYDRLQSLRP